MPPGFGRPSSNSARGSSSSAIRFVCGPWLSLTSTEDAPQSNAPATAALASSVISRRARSYSGFPGWPCAGWTTPATPSMSAEMNTFMLGLLRRAGWSGAGSSQLLVQRVAQPVAEQVERQHGDEYRQAREQREMVRYAEIAPALGQHRAPFRAGR